MTQPQVLLGLHPQWYKTPFCQSPAVSPEVQYFDNERLLRALKRGPIIVRMKRAIEAGGSKEDADVPAAFVRIFDRMHDEVMMPTSRPPLPLHISPPEGRGLVWMGSQNLCTMSEFASGMRVPLSTATHLVDRLVEKGLFVRERSEADRRAVTIRLSEMGKRVHKRFFEQRLAGGKRMLSRLDPKEQAQLLRLMEKAIAPSA